MFRRTGHHGSASARAQAHGRAELQRQLEERLSYWQLFLAAKLEEVHERRNPAGLQDTPGAAKGSAGPVERAGTAARARVTPNSPVQEQPAADDGAPALDERTDDGALDLAEEDA